MEFYPGFDISPQQEPFGFCYGKGVFGPEAEIRRLDDIRAFPGGPGLRRAGGGLLHLHGRGYGGGPGGD